VARFEDLAALVEGQVGPAPTPQACDVQVRDYGPGVLRFQVRAPGAPAFTERNLPAAPEVVAALRRAKAGVPLHPSWAGTTNQYLRVAVEHDGEAAHALLPSGRFALDVAPDADSDVDNSDDCDDDHDDEDEEADDDDEEE